MHINYSWNFHQNIFTLNISFIVLNTAIEFVLIYRPHPVCTLVQFVYSIFRYILFSYHGQWYPQVTYLQYTRSIYLDTSGCCYLYSSKIGHYFWPAAYIYTAAWSCFLLGDIIGLYLQESSAYFDSSRELILLAGAIIIFVRLILSK